MSQDPSKEDIVKLAYQLILGRMPESDAVDKTKTGFQNISDLRKSMMASDEFKMQILTRHENDRLDVLVKNLASQPRNNTSIDFRIIQTCDSANYVPILNASRPILLEYLKRQRVDYDCFIGIKKGCHPWHAIFNRIYMLNELIDQGYKGWVLYLDADAYIIDLDFNFKEYLSDKGEYALIAAQTGRPKGYWDINSGVFFANLNHEVCVNVIQRWKRFYDTFYTNEDYIKADRWDMVLNDQTSLHGMLMHQGFERFLLTEGVRELFNSRFATVIRQCLRPSATENAEDSLPAREKRIAAAVAQILGACGVSDG